MNNTEQNNKRLIVITGKQRPHTYNHISDVTCKAHNNVLIEIIYSEQCGQDTSPTLCLDLLSDFKGDSIVY